MPSLTGRLYDTFFRRNTAMLATVFGTAFAIQFGFDSGSEMVWNAINRGRQWQDIKPAIMARADGGEDDDE